MSTRLILPQQRRLLQCTTISDGAFFKIDWLAVHGIQRHGFTGYEEHVSGETETIKIIVLDPDDSDDKGVESLVLFRPNVKLSATKNSKVRYFMRLLGGVPRP